MSTLSVTEHPAPAGYELSLFRCFRLTQDGKQARVAPRQQRLIAILAIGGPAMRTYVSAVLWPESTERRALDSLRVAIHAVSHSLPGLLALDHSLLALDGRVGIDLHRERERLAGPAGEPGPAGAYGTPATSDAPLLPGWYDEWVLEEQERLQRARVGFLERCAREALSSGKARAAIDAATEALSHDPLNEAMLAVLVRGHLGLGNRVSAIRAVDGFRRMLQRELGLRSSRVLDDLDASIRTA